MSYPLQFRPEVTDDVAEACHWHDDRRAGLGQDFFAELQAALARISETPELYAIGYRDTRSARLHRFPYVVHYHFTGETVTVVAVMHGGRDPSGWQRRT